MSCSGRKKDNIWRHFAELKKIPGEKCKKVQCNLCGFITQSLVSRMKSHFDKKHGKEDDDEIIDLSEHSVEEASNSSNLMAANAKPSSSIAVATPSSSIAAATPSSSIAAATPSSSIAVATATQSTSKAGAIPRSKPTAIPTKTKISSYFIRTSKSEKATLDEKVGKFFYACNISFNAVAHYTFIDLIESLRPGYSPPHRLSLSNQILDSVYDNQQENVSEKLNDAVACLSIDGWSNIRNEPIICASVYNKDMAILVDVDTIDTSAIPHTSVNLQSITSDVIEKTEKKFLCKIKTVVTDNAANMVKMRKDLENSDDVDIFAYGCSAHALNLLAHDLNKLNDYENTRSDVIKILKYFKNHHQPKYWFESAGGSGIRLPLDVRWNSTCDSLNCYIKNWPIFAKICVDKKNHPSFSKAIYDLVLNMNLKQDAEDLYSILNPIAVGLNLIQSNSCRLNECVKIWKRIGKKLEMNEEVHDKFKSRYATSLGPIHYASILLSPTSLCSDEVILNDAEQESGINFIEENLPVSFLPLFYKFRAKLLPFRPSFFKKEFISKMTDEEWWKTAQSSDKNSLGITAGCLNTILGILGAIASSAGIERVFSRFGLVHTKLRNRLGVDKAAKLVFVNRQLNCNMAVDNYLESD